MNTPCSSRFWNKRGIQMHYEIKERAGFCIHCLYSRHQGRVYFYSYCLKQSTKAANNQTFFSASTSGPDLCGPCPSALVHVRWMMKGDAALMMVFTPPQVPGSSMHGLAVTWPCSAALWKMMPRWRGKWTGQMWRRSGGKRGHGSPSSKWTWAAMACTAASRIPTTSGATRSHFVLAVSTVFFSSPSFTLQKSPWNVWPNMVGQPWHALRF